MLSAYLLDPQYKCEFITKEVVSSKRKSCRFSGLSRIKLSLGLFEFFKRLFDKGLGSEEFRRIVSFESETLSKMYLIYTSITALSAQLERIFSYWRYIHNKVRNRLAPARSEMLAYLYYLQKVQNNQDRNFDNE